jgi:hypothetical protein
MISYAFVSQSRFHLLQQHRQLYQFDFLRERPVTVDSLGTYSSSREPLSSLSAIVDIDRADFAAESCAALTLP